MIKDRERLPLMAMGLVAAVLPAIWVDAPGYMDADYYMATALRLAEGHGLSEPFVWNYLADPQAIPHPSHQYWMPLTTLVAAAPMAIFGAGFRVAQIPFLLMTASLPLVAAWLTGLLGGGRRHRLMAGAFAAASGFFLPFFVTTDSFALYALIGSLVFALAARDAFVQGAGRWALLGAVVGLGHLARADGLLLLLPAGAALLDKPERRGNSLIALLIGYAAVMGPWMLRNLALVGSPLAPGASRTMWLTSYDDLFRYPASTLNAADFTREGIGSIVMARVSALGLNLVSLLVVNGLVFLGPLAVLGGWERREKSVVRAAAIYLAGLLFAMTVVFPFSGSRGGFFHSSAALMPAIWALAALGLDRAIEWAGGRRDWVMARAGPVFSLGAVGVAAAATLFLLINRLVIPAAEARGWGAEQRDYARTLRLIPPEAQGRAAVNNPPGFWLASRMPAVVIPNGGEAELLHVVQDFDVTWIVLEANHPQGLDDIYADPSRLNWAEIVGSIDSHEGNPIWVLQVGAFDE